VHIKTIAFLSFEKKKSSLILILLTGFKEGAVLSSISRGLSAPSGVRLHCSDVALPADFYHDIHCTPQVCTIIKLHQ